MNSSLRHLFGAMRASGDFESPYAAGFDCGKNGSNTKNCHFNWFSTKERTAEWERGKKAGESSGVSASGGNNV